jgi:protein-tyrosine phosphatase
MIAAMPTVLFVCSGNLCRSPMAEYLLRSLLDRLPRWQAASAGLAAIPGLPASDEAVRVLAESGIDLTPHRSKPITPGLLSQAAVVAAMTRVHRDCLALLDGGTAQKVFLLGSFGPAAQGREIEDPIGGTVARYRRCRDAIADCLPGLVDFLETLTLPGSA